MIRTRFLHSFISVLAGVFLLLVAVPSAFAESAPTAIYKSQSADTKLLVYSGNGYKLLDRDDEVISTGKMEADGNCTSNEADNNTVDVYFLQLDDAGNMEAIFGHSPDGEPWTEVLKKF